MGAWIHLFNHDISAATKIRQMPDEILAGFLKNSIAVLENQWDGSSFRRKFKSTKNITGKPPRWHDNVLIALVMKDCRVTPFGVDKKALIDPFHLILYITMFYKKMCIPFRLYRALLKLQQKMAPLAPCEGIHKPNTSKSGVANRQAERHSCEEFPDLPWGSALNGG